MTKRRLASMAVGSAALFLLVACGGGSPEEITQEPGTTEEPGTTAPAAFTALAEKAQESTYRFDYKIIGSMGEVQQTGTLYHKPPKFRLDSSFGSPVVSLSTLIWSGDELIQCDRPEGEEWDCIGNPVGGPVDGLPEVIKDPQGFDITEKEGRTLAGQETACFLAVASGETAAFFPEELELCLSQEGAPLFQKTTFRVPAGEAGTPGSPVEIIREATTYSTQVDDSDFEPPAEPSRP